MYDYEFKQYSGLVEQLRDTQLNNNNAIAFPKFHMWAIGTWFATPDTPDQSIIKYKPLNSPWTIQP